MKILFSCSPTNNLHVPFAVSFSSPGLTKCLLLSPSSDRDRRRKKSMEFQHRSSVQSSAITYSWFSLSTAKSGHWYLSHLTPDLMISAHQCSPPKCCWARTRYAGWNCSDKYSVWYRLVHRTSDRRVATQGNSFHAVKGQMRLVLNCCGRRGGIRCVQAWSSVICWNLHKETYFSSAWACNFLTGIKC